jgi:hypothetical protein
VINDLLLCGIRFMIRSNMGLCISMYVAFICNLQCNAMKGRPARKADNLAAICQPIV